MDAFKKQCYMEVNRAIKRFLKRKRGGADWSPEHTVGFYTYKCMTRSLMLKYIKIILFIYFMPTTKRDQNHAFNKCTRSKNLYKHKH